MITMMVMIVMLLMMSIMVVVLINLVDHHFQNRIATMMTKHAKPVKAWVKSVLPKLIIGKSKFFEHTGTCICPVIRKYATGGAPCAPPPVQIGLNDINNA